MPSITFPRDAFRQNIMDYTRETGAAGVDACFWRELLQNARDAGATRVDATVKTEGSITELVFMDNGRGMSRDVLVNGMLTYAGSVKPDGAAGGFGMAKCLLVFAPDAVKIETNDLAVNVEGINYEWLTVEKPINGTRFTVRIDNANYPPEKQITPTVEGLQFLLARCDMGAIRIYCNGERLYDTKLSADAEAVRTWEQFKTNAYHLPRARNVLKNRNGANVMVIQHRGIWVEDRVISNSVKGSVWININEEPRKVLNAARVSVASYDLRDLFNTFLQEIAQAPKQALKTKKWVQRFDGHLIKIESAATCAAMFAKAISEGANLTAEPTGGRGRPTKVCVDDTRELMVELAKLALNQTGGDYDDNRVPASYLEPTRLNITPDMGNEEVSKQIACAVWSPAMMVVNEREHTRHVDAQYMPNTMGKKAKRLLTVWSEMVKQFLIISKAYGCTFGVGFLFSDDELAQWRKEEDGTVWFLLNPIDADGNMRFKLSDTEHRAEMIATAAHEVTHEITQEKYHGDEFSIKVTKMMEHALNHSVTFNEIWKLRHND
jgi:hypothetical protein